MVSFSAAIGPDCSTLELRRLRHPSSLATLDVMYGIHPASLRDIPALIGLMAEFYAESGFPLPEANARAAFTRLLSDPGLGGAWIARDAGEPVGHVVLTVCFSMEYGALRGFVDDLFVRPSARGRGIAGALIDAVVADCSARDVRALLVEVGPDNESGRRVYEKAGLVDTKHLLLARPLAPPLHVSASELKGL